MCKGRVYNEKKRRTLTIIKCQAIEAHFPFVYLKKNIFPFLIRKLLTQAISLLIGISRKTVLFLIFCLFACTDRNVRKAGTLLKKRQSHTYLTKRKRKFFKLRKRNAKKRIKFVDEKMSHSQASIQDNFGDDDSTCNTCQFLERLLSSQVFMIKFKLVFTV